MKIRLIVPVWANNNANTAIDTVATYGPHIADIAGGFTATQATGGWKDDTGNLIVEPVTVFDCVTSDSTSDPFWKPIYEQWTDLARGIARDLSQTCVYLEIDGVVEYVKG